MLTDNIAFSSDGILKLLDFGLCTCIRRSTDLDDRYTMTGGTGSLRYMSPEVSLGVPYNEKTDVYSFGILLWYMATGRTPFDGWDVKELFRRVTRGGERPRCEPGWPYAFRTLLETCWDSIPSKRPSFLEIFNTLEQIAAQLSTRSDGREESCQCSQLITRDNGNNRVRRSDYQEGYTYGNVTASVDEPVNIDNQYCNAVENSNNNQVIEGHVQGHSRNRIERFESSWF